MGVILGALTLAVRLLPLGLWCAAALTRLGSGSRSDVVTIRLLYRRLKMNIIRRACVRFDSRAAILRSLKSSIGTSVSIEMKGRALFERCDWRCDSQGGIGLRPWTVL